MLPTCDRSKVKEEIYDRITISLANVLHYLSLLKKLPVVMFNLAKVVQFRNTVNQPYETKWVNLIILQIKDIGLARICPCYRARNGNTNYEACCFNE